MVSTTSPTKPDGLRVALEKLASLEWEMSPAFPQLIHAFLTAMDYNDSPLLESRANSIFEALQGMVNDNIKKVLGSAEYLQRAWQHIVDFLQEHPSENCDELGKQFEAYLQTGIAALNQLRDGPVKSMEDAGYAIADAPALADGIEELHKLTQSICENWPWSDRPLPPVNREMVARSRAELVLREGESFAEMVRRVRAPRGAAN